jgi:D-beta-D-heptose 7-phosphate kinase/D-beta-D-heptose 1-phosphate adenosyltransferase
VTRGLGIGFINIKQIRKFSLNKLKSPKKLKDILSKLKKQGKKIVFTNGCFDLLHPGHIKLLKEAKSKGDILVVGLNSDNSIKRIKNKGRPILKEKARITNLGALEFVDFIVVFEESTPYKIIKYLKPNYLVKGSDWEENKIVGKDLVERVFRVKLLKNYSTTSIINKIIHNFKNVI